MVDTIDINNIIINPQINELIIKILAYRFDDDQPLYPYIYIGELGAKLILSLNPSKEVRDSLNIFLDNLRNPSHEIKEKYGADRITEYFNNIRIEESKKLLKLFNTTDTINIAIALLRDINIKGYSFSDWDVNGELIKNWRPRLIDSLKEIGFQYDENKKEFNYSNKWFRLTTTPYLSTSFIDADFGNETLYEKLKIEINNCYSYGFFTATLVLSRKLTENMLIDILRKKYPPNVAQNLEIYYTQEKRRFKDLSDLISELSNRKSDFEPDINIVEDILKLIHPLRESANSSAHSIFYADKDGVEDLKIPKLVEKLEYLKNRLI